ncbi:MAG: VCBS repeat-containing protein [Alphaproteobacteria bacterium]|nr:VCBS repeat-containing protein [Alphaproteobacteria bacterium]MDP6624596.1 VCBS repeat-containing protein [Alphaproteobacteria bacterium]
MGRKRLPGLLIPGLMGLMALPVSAADLSVTQQSLPAPFAVESLESDQDGLAVIGSSRWARLRLDDGKISFENQEEPRASPAQRPGMLPGGSVTLGSGRIRAAWLNRPTERYRHGVLGDAIEAGGLAVDLADGRSLETVLGPGSVFEDLAPRLLDVDGNGQSDLVVVRSYLQRGAALAAFSVGTGGLRLLGQSPPIGRPNRWLNPIGAGDFDGDGRIELAAVVTPHIGGVLTLYRLEAGLLRPTTRQRGFSNHAIGSRQLGLAAILDVNGDSVVDLLVPNDNRRSLRVVSFVRRFAELARVDHEAQIASAIVVFGSEIDPQPRVAYVLADGTFVVLSFDLTP